MTKSTSRSQVRLIASTNAIFGADEACAMPRISRDAMYRLAKDPDDPSRSSFHARHALSRASRSAVLNKLRFCFKDAINSSSIPLPSCTHRQRVL